MRKEFIKFLKEHNAFVPFVVQLSHREKISLTEHLAAFKNSRLIECLVVYAFVWRHSLQGYRYWREIHCKWVAYIESKK